MKVRTSDWGILTKYWVRGKFAVYVLVDFEGWWKMEMTEMKV
jgi:hypothetical protein